MPPDQLSELDDWIAHNGALSRPEALRRLMDIAQFKEESDCLGWPPELISALDEWIGAQPKPLRRPQAIRHLIAKALREPNG